MDGRSPYLNPYPKTSEELDLREEFRKTLYGSFDEVPKGRVALFRKMRRDSNRNLLRCPCRDPLTDEPDRDRFCPVCWGHGWYWDEKYITYFANEDSYKIEEATNKEYVSNLIYVEYNTEVTDEDYIISVRTDFDGNVIIPVERLTFYKIYDARHYKSDKGRTEYIMLRTREEQSWSTWYGVKNRQNGN